MGERKPVHEKKKFYSNKAEAHTPYDNVNTNACIS